MNFLKEIDDGAEDCCFLEGLSSLECVKILSEAKKKGFKVERIGCWTSEEDYFMIHDYERFCDDYLIDLDGWEFKAYEQIMSTYKKKILDLDPSNLPVFEITIHKTWSDPEMVKLTLESLKRLRNDPEYIPKDFATYNGPTVVDLD